MAGLRGRIDRLEVRMDHERDKPRMPIMVLYGPWFEPHKIERLLGLIRFEVPCQFDHEPMDSLSPEQRALDSARSGDSYPTRQTARRLKHQPRSDQEAGYAASQVETEATRKDGQKRPDRSGRSAWVGGVMSWERLEAIPEWARLYVAEIQMCVPRRGRC